MIILSEISPLPHIYTCRFQGYIPIEIQPPSFHPKSYIRQKKRQQKQGIMKQPQTILPCVHYLLIMQTASHYISSSDFLCMILNLALYMMYCSNPYPAIVIANNDNA